MSLARATTQHVKCYQKYVAVENLPNVNYASYAGTIYTNV